MCRSGRLFPEHAKQGTPLSSRVAPAAELRRRALWVTHGEADGVTPVSLAHDSMRTAAALYGTDADGAAAFATSVLFQPHRSGHDIPGAALHAAASALQQWSK